MNKIDKKKIFLIWCYHFQFWSSTKDQRTPIYEMTIDAADENEFQLDEDENEKSFLLIESNGVSISYNATSDNAQVKVTTRINYSRKGEEKDDDVDSGVSDSTMIGENGDAPGEEDLDDISLLGGLTSAGLHKQRQCRENNKRYEDS